MAKVKIEGHIWGLVFSWDISCSFQVNFTEI